MTKKLTMLLAAIVLVAFAMPTFASANSKVTDPPGTLALVGAKIQATNIGAVTIQASLGLITCATVDFTGQLTHNTGFTYRGIGISTGSTATCHVGGKPAMVTDLTIKEFHSATTGKGTINMTFKVDLPDNLLCHYESPDIPFTITGTDTIKITNGDFKGTPAFCDPGLLNGTFTLETDVAPFTQLHLD